MKIECEKIEHKSYSTNCTVDSYCCRMMKKAIKDFQRTYKDGSGHFNANFMIKECGIQIPLTHGYDYGVNEWVTIYFCPWCGKEIE